MRRFMNIPMDTIHQKIVKSIVVSDQFENDLHKMFASTMVDMFIHKCDGLKLFYDNHTVTKLDMEIYFKTPIIELFGEKFYKELFNSLGADE